MCLQRKIFSENKELCVVQIFKIQNAFFDQSQLSIGPLEIPWHIFDSDQFYEESHIRFRFSPIQIIPLSLVTIFCPRKKKPKRSGVKLIVREEVPGKWASFLLLVIRMHSEGAQGITKYYSPQLLVDQIRRKIISGQ